jgi:hypothetical protein
MKPTYDAAVKEEVHKRMSPPSRESIPEIARYSGLGIGPEFEEAVRLHCGGVKLSLPIRKGGRSAAAEANSRAW